MSGNTETASFVQSLAQEIHDLNGRESLSTVDLRLVPDLQNIPRFGLITGNIVIGYPEGGASPTRFLSQQDDALVFAPDDTISGTNWVSLETRFMLHKENSILAVRIEGVIDRVNYPDVFVRNNFSGAIFRPGKVAVLSPKDGNTMLLINLSKSATDEPHTLTLLFNKGNFTYRINGISFVSL